MDDLWQLLRDVTQVSFEARSRAGTGWDGIGTGVVSVSEPSPGVSVFTESGDWRSQGREARFDNVFRWTRLDTSIRLEHLRFGPDQPVFLFDLAQAEGEIWRAVSPHVCVADCYSGELRIEARAVRVDWSVRGPHKDEAIRYRYQ